MRAESRNSNANPDNIKEQADKTQKEMHLIQILRRK